MLEQITDPIDQAANLAQLEADRAVARHQSGAKYRQKNTQKYCIDCDEEIPAARKSAAPWAIRCIECPQDIER